MHLPDGRLLQYVVSGGGGAFMHATHQIEKVDLPGVTEADFRCYPLRGDSLARYSQLYDSKLHTRGRLRLTPPRRPPIWPGCWSCTPPARARW